MTEISLKTPDDVIRQLNELPNSFIFRGQSNADWALESSLERILAEKWSPDNARKFEEHALQRFQSKFHLYDGENLEPSSLLGWLSLMQHYGAPTRLLDFTESPFVALYFALEATNPKFSRDRDHAEMAIFALNYSKMMEASLSYIKDRDSEFKHTKETLRFKQDEIFETIVDRFSYPIAWAIEPQRINKRLDRQAGCFLIGGDRGIKIETILASPMYKDAQLTKFRISREIYDNLYALLRKMNINSKTLYGDLGGLCRAVRMELQIYAA